MSAPQSNAPRLQAQLRRAPGRKPEATSEGGSSLLGAPESFDPRMQQRLFRAATTIWGGATISPRSQLRNAEGIAGDQAAHRPADLETFVTRAEIDPVYFDTPYYLYPDGPMAVEALRVIGAAMAEAAIAGIGRLTLSRRERMVIVEPRGAGMALFTLRAANEVRAAQFGSTEGDPDTEMVAIARAIIARDHPGSAEPAAFEGVASTTSLRSELYAPGRKLESYRRPFVF